MNFTKIINPENVSEEEASGYTKREAARAVVFDGEGNIALLHVGDENFYKISGGGIEEGEDIEKALRRECLEEIGCDIKDILEVGKTIEYRKESQLYQISHCFTARVDGPKKEPEFDAREIGNKFSAGWHTPHEAYQLLQNQHPQNYYSKFMALRDQAIAQEVLKI